MLRRAPKTVESYIADDHECAICLELLYRPVLLSCKHRFCGGCATSAAERFDNCPLCGCAGALKRAQPNQSLEKKLKESYPRAYKMRAAETTKAAYSKFFKDFKRAWIDVDVETDVPMTRSQRS